MAQGNKGPREPGHRGTRAQGHKITRAQGHKDGREVGGGKEGEREEGGGEDTYEYMRDVGGLVDIGVSECRSWGWGCGWMMRAEGGDRGVRRVGGSWGGAVVRKGELGVGREWRRGMREGDRATDFAGRAIDFAV
jgi:hypothetical protein